MAVHWNKLCCSPRVWASAKPVVTRESCDRIIAACRGVLLATEAAENYTGVVDYRSAPISACGDEALAAFRASGAIEETNINNILVDCSLRRSVSTSPPSPLFSTAFDDGRRRRRRRGWRTEPARTL